MAAYYEETKIQKGRIYGKSELAQILEISRFTFSQELRRIRPVLKRRKTFNKYKKTLSPVEVRIVLIELGFIEK